MSRALHNRRNMANRIGKGDGLNILQAMEDPAVFGHAFRDPNTWAAWRAFLAALFGLPMDAELHRIYAE